MKKDVPFPAFAEDRRTQRGDASHPPLRVARSPEGLYAVLPGDEDTPEPPVLPVFERRETAILLARLCLTLGLEDLAPFDS